MYENERPSEEKEESMNDILTSIRELVYPRRQDAFEKEEAARTQGTHTANHSQASENKVVIDLMRPVQDTTSDLAAREQLLKDAALREAAARDYAPRMQDIPVIEEELSKEIFRAFSSFEQAVTHPKPQPHASSSADPVDYTSHKARKESVSESPNQFLEQLVREALVSSLYQKIEDLAAPVIHNAVQALLPQMLDAWMKKNLSSLVINCVEKKLDEMKEKASDRRF